VRKKHIRSDYERSDPLLRKFGKCRVNFSLGAGIQDEEFDAQSLRGLPCIFHLRLKAWARRIDKETHGCGGRDQFTQQL
jgi:hypothetical protein